jgi:hypothetical protein
MSPLFCRLLFSRNLPYSISVQKTIIPQKGLGFDSIKHTAYVFRTEGTTRELSNFHKMSF